jgi:hypothetical protein
MYCSHCGTELFYKDLRDDSWCNLCVAVVDTWPCKVPFWILMAVFTMMWPLMLNG